MPVINAEGLDDLINLLSSPTRRSRAAQRDEVQSQLLASFLNEKAKNLTFRRVDGTPKTQEEVKVDVAIREYWVNNGLQAKYNSNPKNFRFPLNGDSIIPVLSHVLQGRMFPSSSPKDVSNTEFATQLTNFHRGFQQGLQQQRQQQQRQQQTDIAQELGKLQVNRPVRFTFKVRSTNSFGERTSRKTAVDVTLLRDGSVNIRGLSHHPNGRPVIGRVLDQTVDSATYLSLLRERVLVRQEPLQAQSRSRQPQTHSTAITDQRSPIEIARDNVQQVLRQITEEPQARLQASVEPTARPQARPQASVEPTARPQARPQASVEPTAPPLEEGISVIDPINTTRSNTNYPINTFTETQYPANYNPQRLQQARRQTAQGSEQTYNRRINNTRIAFHQ